VYPLPPWVYPEDIDDTSKTPNFTGGLQSRGYSEAAIRSVLGENFMRVFNQVWRS
jgi:membrane dipeptidase